MKAIKWLVIRFGLAFLLGSRAFAAEPTITLSLLRGNIYVAEDTFYSKENSAVYVGANHVTVIGATWTPETANLLVGEIAKITKKPVTEVIDTNYHPDRAGGNGYFKFLGAKIISTEKTRELMKTNWDAVVLATHQANPDYPVLPAVLPETIYPGDFTLQDGGVKVIYLGPSHTPDGVFVYFPREKVLYGGCILKEQLGNLAYANLEEYPKTLRKLQHLNLGFTTIIAGHYSPIHGPELIDHYIEMLKQSHR